MATPQMATLRRMMKDARKKACLTALADHNSTISLVGPTLDLLQESAPRAERFHVVSIFKELEGAGFGRFYTGRRGHESRLLWNQSPRDYLNQLERPKEATVDSIMALEQRESEPEPEVKDFEHNTSVMMKHSYWLRGDFQVEVSLPIDFNEKEAERLANFLRSLPL